MVYLGFLPRVAKNLSAWRASLSTLDSRSNMEQTSQRKYRAVVSLPCVKWVYNLRRRLLLLPLYMMALAALANWYAPSSCGTRLIFSKVNLDHLFCIGMIHLLSPIWYNMGTTDLALGGLEPPRQLASGCQDRHVCQFHHSAVRSGGSAPAKMLLPLSTPQLRNYHKTHPLSIGKSTDMQANIGYKSIKGGSCLFALSV